MFIENLLQNALDKRRSHSRMGIEARLELVLVQAKVGLAALTVCDDGAAIPAKVEAELFVGPVLSENGYGIGLFQAARQAGLAGYRLELLSNRPGKVCFRLAPVAT